MSKLASGQSEEATHEQLQRLLSLVEVMHSTDVDWFLNWLAGKYSFMYPSVEDVVVEAEKIYGTRK